MVPEFAPGITPGITPGIAPRIAGASYNDCNMRNALFQTIARIFPTRHIGTNRLLSAIWRTLFYLIRPNEPFIMQTAHYPVEAHPGRETLTRALIRRGYWEPLETRVFVELLSPGVMVVDAGANFGHYALTASSLVGRNGLVFAFEPHGPTHSLLSRNAGLQQHRNLRPVRAGLGAEDAELPIYADAGNPGGHSFLDWNRREDTGTAETVPIFALDGFLAREAPGRTLSMLKIDVQGFEMDVLNGAAETITRDRPNVLCEVTPGVLARTAGGHRILLTFFEGRDYRATILWPDEDRLEPVEFDRLARMLDETDREYFDVLFQAAPE
jgi:FkbM family methyltransferase